MLLIYTIVFLGFFAGALVSPVLSPMFLHPTEHGVLPDGTSVATRAMLLGVAMGMMRFGEFIGSPFSDSSPIGSDGEERWRWQSS